LCRNTFYPRDTAKRGFCCRKMSVSPSVRPSVCLSVTLLQYQLRPKLQSTFFLSTIAPSLHSFP